MALGLALILFAVVAEGFLAIRNLQIFNLAATRDLLRLRYFLQVECLEILRTKKEENHLSEESFFTIEAKLREITKSQFDSRKAEPFLFVRLTCEIASEVYRKSSLLPVQVRFERSLPGAKTRSYEIQSMFFLF